MLIEFKLKNHLSFKEEAVFSMIASSIEEHQQNTCITKNSIKTLKSSVFYGANGSGKSNLFHAIRFLKNFVIASANDSLKENPIKVDRFKLDDSSVKDNCGFEVTFLHEDIIYRYGFAADESKIHEEWLFYTPKKREIKLFERKEQSIFINKSSFPEGITLLEKTRDNTLFLSVNAMLNGPISKNVINWFNQLNIISGINDDSYANFTMKMIRDHETYRQKATELLKSIGIGMESIKVETLKIDEDQLSKVIPEDIRRKIAEEGLLNIEFIKPQYGKKGDEVGKVAMHLSSESEGTQKIFNLSGPLFHTLLEGKVLIIDELDARLHPLITKTLVALFHSDDTNPHHAQLIFATHDTNLLSNDLFRRDQIWFVEKDQQESSHIYSLNDFKTNTGQKIRNDNKYEKNYIAGKFGAIPYINTDELVSFLRNE